LFGWNVIVCVAVMVVTRRSLKSSKSPWVWTVCEGSVGKAMLGMLKLACLLDDVMEVEDEVDGDEDEDEEVW